MQRGSGRFGPPSRGSSSSSFRPDIEGLRAVAVVLVVLSHLADWPSGGFIGVDVFFVISGFLITGLLLDETERRGRLSFRGFYARRARRILPAALTVLAAVVVAAHLVFRGARVTQTVTDVKWALGFSANIHFARIDTDYFQANRAPSLVQHFWSLAVEEQFYIVWPVLIVIVLTLTRSLRLLLAVVAVGSAASFGYALHEATQPTTYFSSPARAWELGVGAFLAVATRVWTLALPGRRLVHLVGLAGIVAGAFVVPSKGFPAGWVALPVLATAAVIAAGPVGGVVGGVLTNPVSRYVGRISYSLYLWHWPVILVVAALVPTPWGLKYSIAVFAMLGLAIASYHFVEAPMRRMRFRRPAWRRPQWRRPAWRRPWRRPRSSGLVAGRRPATAALGCLAMVVLLSVLVPGKHPPSFATAAADAPPGLAHAGPDVAQPHNGLATAIDQALAATGFPDFDPPVDQLGSARGHWGACDGATEDELAKCTFGSTAPDARVAVVIGDSVAMSWLPGIDAALADSNWRIYGLTLEACPAAALSVLDVHGAPFGECDQRHKWVTREVNRLDPQLVVLASTDDTLSRIADGATGATADAEYRTALQRTITALHPGPGRHVLTVSPPPLTNDLALCNTAGSTPADCVRSVSDRWIAFAQAEQAAAAATHTSYADTHLWFCNSAGICPAFIGTTLVRWDGQHVTDVYARSLASDIRAVIDRASRPE